MESTKQSLDSIFVQWLALKKLLHDHELLIVERLINIIMEPQKAEKEKEFIPTCKFYIKRKCRPCKFPTVKGSEFCHNHCSDLEGKVECPY